MGGLLSRFTIIDNTSEGIVELRECTEADPQGRSYPAILLEPNTRKFIPSRKFHRHCIDSSIPRAIKLYSNGACFKTLTPEDFIANIKLKVMVNDDGQLALTRVRAAAQDQFRMKALVCFLGDITDRTEEPL